MQDKIQRMRFAEIILPIATPKVYTYSIPQHLSGKIKTGQRVIVYVKSKLYTGIVLSVHDKEPEYETKPIEDILDNEPFITKDHLKFWQWVADYYMCTIGEVYTAALPPSLRLEGMQKLYLTTSNIEGIILTAEEEKIFNILKKQSYTISELAKKTGNKNILHLVKSLVEKGLIRSTQEIINPYKPRTEKFIRLSPDLDTQEKLDKAIQSLGRAKKQLELLLAYITLARFTFASEPKEVKYKDLLDKVNSPSALKALVDKGLLQVYEKPVLRISSIQVSRQINPLTPAQKKALEEIKEHFREKNVVLLHGVTSSGKTEIYIHLIKDQIDQGKQVLYLLPEIAITSQIVLRLQAVFGDQVGFFHSRLNDNERAEVWQRLSRRLAGKPPYKIIIGVRSATFLPFNNLGLVIVDEEHENTYKQFDPAPRYNARDAAIMLASITGAKVLLGTATPSLESYYNALNGKYGLVELMQRFADVQLPQIVLADTRAAQKKKQMHGIFHPLLLKKIDESLTQGKQIILFRNRRGFAPYLECQDCGWIPKCKHCDVSLTYHKDANKLVCHYCGYTIEAPRSCQKCGSFRLQLRSFGTERVEDELKIYFPEAHIQRLDLDTTRGKYAHSQIIDRFQKKEIDILVGTQMVTKGLDFENVNLVGILNADSLVNYPDFRAIERAYQLMVQVSGRAGRRNAQGLVIIQTAHPDHPVFHYVIENDYQGMFRWLLGERKAFFYPPFSRIIKIIIRHKDEALVDNFANLLAASLRKFLGHRVLGPQYPPVKKVQNWYRKELLIKLEPTSRLSRIKKKITEITNEVRKVENFYKLHVIFDVDPM